MRRFATVNILSKYRDLPVLRKFRNSLFVINHKSALVVVAVLLGFAIVGSVVYEASHAATSAFAIEAEAGILGGKAQVVSNTNASGGKAVLFGSATTPPPPPPSTGVFPPKAGTLFYGMSEGPGSPLLDSGVNPGLDREYFQASNVSGMVDYARVSAARGSLPILSIKPPSDWQSIANGKQDAWVKSIINQLTALNVPVLWTIHHEPENDVNGTTQTAATFKAMCEHVTAMHDTATSKVRFGPILMSGKYNPVATPNSSVRLKATDWVSPKSGHYYGFDGYNHFDPSTGKLWRSVPDTFNWMVNGGTFNKQTIIGLRDIDATKPIVIAEYGVRDDPNDPTRSVTWMTDAYKYSINNGIAGMSYFSSSQNVNDGGGSWELKGPRLTEFKRLLALPTSVYTK